MTIATTLQILLLCLASARPGRHLVGWFGRPAQFPGRRRSLHQRPIVYAPTLPFPGQAFPPGEGGKIGAAFRPGYSRLRPAQGKRRGHFPRSSSTPFPSFVGASRV